MRWFYAINQAVKQRANLKSFLTTPAKQVHSVFEITAKRLDDAGIAILALDFDGVLGPYNAIRLAPEVEQWLRKLSLEIGEHRIAILTNNPKTARIKYFTENFPMIFMPHGRGFRRKPYPDGLLDIAANRGVPPHRVVLVDDRLFTGMLATCLAYTQGWYFNPPICNYWRNPVKESFFSFLRVLERGLIRLIG